MKFRILPMLAAVALLAACETSTDANGGAGGAGGGAGIPGSEHDFQTSVGDRVFFAFDRYDLDGQARDQLGKWVAFLKKYPNDNMIVEGHADERGTREYNLALGERRANAIKNYLVAQGIQASRLKVISYGKERPAVLGSNEAAWAQNRRGVGVIN